jgi:DNA polymerase III alpha subunit
MYTDIYGQPIYTEQDLLSIYLTNTEFECSGTILVDQEIVFDDSLELKNIPELVTYTLDSRTIQEFDADCKNQWFMPDEYRNLDIAKYVLSLCSDEEELQRVGKELLLYQERDMFTLLQYLKYLVDTMRQHNIVWGVGRGSSVASFVLFLLGVHKINSLFYQLDIEEFLK